MPVTYEMCERVLTAQLSGELDHHRTRAVMQDLESQIASRYPRQLVLDLSGVSFMDSSGIALLLRALRLMRESGGSAQATGVPPQAGRVLRAAGLQSLLPIQFLEH